MKSVIEKIKCQNLLLNAFITVNDNIPEPSNVDSMPLSGMPIAIKDNICTYDMETTCASRMLEKFKPCYDAQVVELLRNAGAIIVGKTNMDEFGMGSTGENSYFGAVKNPINTEYVTGGSSSGSAAAVAAGLVPVAIGSDTGGSVRQPAAHCGVVGLKPSYGAVSRFGLIAFASSMDQIGILGQDVTKVRKIAEVIYGKDDKDMTSCEIDIKNLPQIDEFRVGVCEEYNKAAQPDILAGVQRALSALSACGGQTVKMDIPMTEYVLSMYYILSSAEASSNLSRFDGIKYGFSATDCKSVDELIRLSRCQGFGDEVKRRILLGTFVLAEGYYDNYYLRAERARDNLKAEYNAIFSDKCDIIISPVTMSAAPKIGEFSSDPDRMHESDFYTVSANLAGLPAISIPVGLNCDGLPIGVQLMAGYGKDALLLTIAEKLEKALNGGGKL